MQKLAGCLMALMLGCGCGGVSVEDPAGPTLSNPVPPVPRPLPTAESVVCPGATVSHADDVALWYRASNGVAFVHHDGSQQLAMPLDENAQVALDVSTGGGRIYIATHTMSGSPSHVVRFDRDGTELGERVFSEGFVTDLWTGSDGRLAFSVSMGETHEGFVWDGDELSSLGSWIPMGPMSDGWVPARSTWETSASYAFVKVGGETSAFPSGEHVWRAGPRLVMLDDAKKQLVIGEPGKVSTFQLPAFGLQDEYPPYIEQARDEGWLLIRRGEYTAGDVLVANAASGEIHHVWLNGGQPMLSFYCNSAWPGYVASDGSLLSSYIGDGALQVVRTEWSGEVQPVGKPLSAVALVDVAERAGTVVISGSDGSDTYCGSGEQIWPNPAPAGSLLGDSLQAQRQGGELRLGKFIGSFAPPAIHPSGACLLSLGSDPPGEWSLEVQDLDSGSYYALGASTLGSGWVE